MNAAVAPHPPQAGPRARLDAIASRVGLDAVELGALIALAVIAMVPLIALVTQGRPLSGADGLLATDQLQYFAWIREAGNHILAGNLWDLQPGERRFLHPGFLLSGLLHRFTGLSIPASYLLLWKPVAIGLTFTGCLVYVRRLLAPGGRRHAALLIALFAVMPASAVAAWTGWGGKPREYSFDFISGEMWSGQYLWGYLMTAIAVFTMPFVLLGLERWRGDRARTRLLILAAVATLLVTWLQPWQGATLAAIVWGVEGWRWLRSRERPAWAMLTAIAVAVVIPSAYYLWLSKVDPAWELAGKSNAAGSQALWSWPWWAMALTVAPLAVPAVLAYRQATPSWQDVAVRIWPLAILVVYLLPLGTFPYHAFQGLTLPLAILAVQGVVSVWPHPRPVVVAVALGLLILPGLAHKLQVAKHSVHSGGDPFYVFGGEVDALKALESDPRPGAVLAPSYASYMTPYRTGREVYLGPFSWTPDWTRRQQRSNDLFEGRLTGAAARRFVVSTHARWLFADCRPLTDLTATLAPLLAAPPRRFGCATLYELKDRPDMARAAGAPDA